MISVARDDRQWFCQVALERERLEERERAIRNFLHVKWIQDECEVLRSEGKVAITVHALSDKSEKTCQMQMNE